MMSEEIYRTTNVTTPNRSFHEFNEAIYGNYSNVLPIGENDVLSGLVFRDEEREAFVSGPSDDETVRRIALKYDCLDTRDRMAFEDIATDTELSLEEIETLLDGLDEKRELGRDWFLRNCKSMTAEELMRKLDDCVNWAKLGSLN